MSGIAATAGPARAGGTEGYPGIKGCLAAAIGMGGADREGFLGMNAARFLGLSLVDDRKTEGRIRLERFRQRSGGDPAFYHRWN